MTKRKDIIRKIRKYAKETNQTMTVKEGGNHTKIWVGNHYTTIGRHNEIDNKMAKRIYTQIGLEH